MKVSLFATCLVDLFKPEVGIATVEVLERLGCTVDFPENQVCCGQPTYNSGYQEEAKEAMKNMIRSFEKSDYIVTTSGSCGFMFKEYPHVFANDPEWLNRAKLVADRTYEFTQFIVDVLKVENVGATLVGKGTYHASCHMTRLLGVKDAPATLLANVEGLEMVPLPYIEKCCGFGGTFSAKMPDISEQMVDEKVESIMETEADYLIGGDMGCLANIGGRLERLGKKVKVLHIAEVLNSNVKQHV